ncbi:MAG TPA: hypothetical protein VKF82_00060 [Candidatus Eremiobacteraceae bacterium]|nr:hypothetical protein [Candidatus Eremiobacteraceae bacterium]
MTWFAGSLIIWSRTAAPNDDNPDPPCHFWERVMMVEADDVDRAVQKLTDFGNADAAENSTQPDEGDDIQPSSSEAGAEQLVFMGVRKVRAIESVGPPGAEPAGDLVEVMFSEMEARNKTDLLKVAAGKDVIVRYID